MSEFYFHEDENEELSYYEYIELHDLKHDCDMPEPELITWSIWWESDSEWVEDSYFIEAETAEEAKNEFLYMFETGENKKHHIPDDHRYESEYRHPNSNVRERYHSVATRGTAWEK